MSTNAVGTGAVAGTDSSDPSSPKAPLLFAKAKKRIISRLREDIENARTRIRNSKD